MAELVYTSLYADSSLKAYYMFGSGLVTDSSSTGATLTNNNTVAEASYLKFAHCADFGSSNTNKYFTSTNNLGINGGAISMSCWVRILTEPSGATYNLMYQANTSADVSYRIRYTDSGGTKTLVFRRERAGTANDDASATVTALGTTAWHHVVFTYDGTTSLGYQNNSQIATVGSTGNGSADPLSGISLGATPNGSQPASVYLADCAFFNKKLSTTEIALLYNDGPKGAALFF